MQQAGTTIDNHWAAGGGDNHKSWGEDGGWSQGPKVTGSGWTETGLNSENSQDIGTWQNPLRSDQNWNQNTNKVIVDSTDKEAWPSIRPGESVSDASDNSSAKSASVISSSSNQGQNIDITKVSSAMQSQSASSPWGATSTFGGIESNPWGPGNSPSPSAVNQNSLGWSSSNPHPSLSVNNQGHNMQTVISSSGSDNISNNKNPPISSLGWGSGTQGQGAIRPQNSMQISTSNGNSVHGMLPSVSGAQQSGPNVSSSRNGSNPWPSNSFGDLTGFPKTSESGWNNPTAVMNNGASAEKDKRGNNINEPSTEPGSSVWGKSNGFGASGWDQNPGNNKPQAPGPQWDNGNTKSQWGDNPSGAAKSQGSGNNPEHLSWAQAACKGLPPSGNSGNEKSPSEQPSQEQVSELSRAIDSHEGWGRKQVHQNSSWDLELSKTAQVARVDDGGAANVWDNNNGTAIWEASRDNQNRNQSGWNGATSGPQWNKEKESNQWSGPVGPDNNQVGGGGSDGSIGNWNVPDSSNPSVWGTKTETGSWKEAAWEDPRQQDGTVHWSGEMVKPKSWSSTPSTPSTPITPAMIQKEDWNKGGVGGGSGGGPPPPPTRPGGWGNPSNGGDRVDDGTSIWAGNAQQQARASGWGDTGSQWNPTVGTKNKSSWCEGENWNSANRKQDWTDERGGWGSVDVGYWNDNSQENSSWSSASGWKNKQQVVKGDTDCVKAAGRMLEMPPNKFPPSGGGYHPQNQMRVRLLQQLVSMGYKKEDAQTSLIRNDMNFDGALAELANSGVKKDNDMDVFQAKAKTGMMPDGGGLNDISENHLESNPHVPNFPMQNTPFQNAQVPNQPFMSMYDRSKIGTSLPTSSPNPMNSSSINPTIQPKFMPPQKLQQQQQAPSSSPTQGPLARNLVPVQNPGQNAMHQQQQMIYQQLRLAVQSGLISQKLLDEQLPHHILLLLQQLLQYQFGLQKVITHQSRPNIQPMERQQLQTVINSIRQQILNTQKQISQAQVSFVKNTQPQNPNMDPLIPLQTELTNLSMNSASINPQPQSRLTQWKSGSGDKENDADNLNKAVGSKPMHQSQSSPNLGRFEDLSILNISGDTTWSTNATTLQNWPTTSAEGTTVQLDAKDSSENKESLTLAASSVSLTDVIPEFVPGKPWQGFSSKNVEDDPHITPGSFSRSFSVNVVKDDYLDNLSSKNPNSTTSADWGKGSKSWGTPESGLSDWSGGSVVPSNMTSGRQPPGLSLQANRSNNWQRQNSWAGHTDKSAFTPVGGNWDKAQKMQWIILKNLSQQIDVSTLKTLCQQHGPLNCFCPLPQLGSAIVCYSSKEEAAKAQRALNQCVLGSITIFAEFITEEEATQYAKHSSMNLTSQWSQNQQQQMSQLNIAANTASPWSSAPAPYQPTSGSGNMWSSGLWSGPTDDHNSNPLVNNILGGQSM